MRNPVIELSTSALIHNFQKVKQLAPASKVVCMVKADAYGHGIAFAIDALKDADAFGVACIQEAREIRALGYSQPITLIEGAFDANEWQEAAEHGFECVIHHQQQVEWALATPELYQQKNLKIWLKLNSGMNRLGFKSDNLYQAAQQLKEAGFELVLTMHFANADQTEHPLNKIQIEQFFALKQKLNPIKASCCNSAAIFNLPELHFDYVRPGIMLYGSSPFADQTAHQLDLKAVMTFKSHIIAIHHIDQDQSVGYGSTFITQRPTRLGVIAAGYGDGYPRAVQGAYVLIHDQQTPLLGRVSMDMFAVDLTDLPSSVSIGTEVILWGDNLSVDMIASTNQTIGYELLCRVTKRPARLLCP
jgi:alanine racemase